MTGCLLASASALGTLDWVTIGAYFAVIMGVAWWVVLKNKDTADDYFLAGRNLGWFVVGASIFASNIGSEHLVGLAGSGNVTVAPGRPEVIHRMVVVDGPALSWARRIRL